MKTPFVVCMALLCMLNNDITHEANPLYPTSCSAAPNVLDVEQPDGSVLSILAKGNAIIHYTETVDGYTLIQTDDKGYEYALLDGSGQLIPSGIPAHNENSRTRRERRGLRHIEPHLRMSEAMSAARLAEFESQREFRGSRDALRFPATGNQKVLVILIQYPDLIQEHSQENFNALMNEEDYNGTGSFRDYFLKNSLGQLDLNADVFGWYTSAEDHDYYGYINGFQRSRELMAEAIDAAEAAGVDFSQYDNDGDGVVDAVVGVHSGPGAEVGAQTQYIWSHRWTLGASYERNYDGVVISDYMINPETRPWGMVGVGVFCHEFGHVLGLPDLYDTDNSSSGIGNWGLMSNGAWLNLEKTPANMNAWSKLDQTWLQPEVITSGAYTLDAADSHAACYRINTSDPKEYFLLENRQNIGNDTYLPGSGLAVWHIDEDKTEMYPAANNVNSDENNKGVDLEEADGLFQLDTGPFQGDAGDLFPGVAYQTRFTETSFPSSNMNDGSSTDISVTNIWENDGVVHFRLNDEVTCNILYAEAGQGSNCQDGSYDQEVMVTYEYPPHDGFLMVNGQSFEIANSPQTVILQSLPSDGQTHDINVEFSVDLSCAYLLSNAFTASRSYDHIITTWTCDPNAVGSSIQLLSTTEGCDSIITVNTLLLPSYDITVYGSTCSFDLAGTFTSVHATSMGCDSIVTLINDYIVPDTVVNTFTTCDPQQAGVELLHLVTASGCDSMVRNETILLLSYDLTIHDFTCDPAQVGRITTIHSTVNGCDSLVTRVTELGESYDIYLEEITCDPDEEGVVSHLHTSSQGCDSLVTINRTYNEFTSSFDPFINGNDVQYSNSSENADVFLWFFGDGSMSTEAEPSHEYTAPGLYQVLLATINQDCGRMKIHSVWITIDDGEVPEIPENEAASVDMRVYPNPTFGPVDVEISGFEDEQIRMSVYDMNGHMVHEEEMQHGNTTYRYDLSGAAPGMYMLQVASQEEVINKKFFMAN